MAEPGRLPPASMARLGSPARSAPRPLAPLAPRLSDTPMPEQNAASIRQPQERQRVRRACMECRIKKVKCNGTEPCARCTSLDIRCEYADQNFRDGSSIDSSQVEKLEARMASMEQMFHSIFAKVDALQAPTPASTLSQASMTPPAAPPRQDAVAESSSSKQYPDQAANSSSEVPKNISRIQQLLDAAAEAEELAAARSSGLASQDEPPPYTSKCGSSPAAGADHGGPISLEAPDQDQNQDQSASKQPHGADCSCENHWSAADYYADTFGELDVDCNGQLRYVGIGSTVANVDHCIGLRRHIDRGLKKRGYESEVPFLTIPEATRLVDEDEAARFYAPLHDLPPAPLVNVLIDIYADQLAYLFPITTEQNMHQIHDTLRQQQQHLRQSERDNGYGAVFFALLAVASPLLPTDHAVLQALGPKWRAKANHLGALFYNEAMRYVNMPFRGKNERYGRSRDIVTALGLLSMYLAETGSQAEAWIAVGRAIRNAQDLGLHRSPERLRLPKEERNKRRHIWWCLYILERQLCTALGRPLSIDDQDCDIEVPYSTLSDGPGNSNSNSREDGVSQKDDVLAGFFASMVHLHRIIGQILKIVNSVRNADAWRSSLTSNNDKINELRIRVSEANERLQWWARDMVPAPIKTARSGPLLAAKHVALSSFFSAVMLLHRVFMSNPHRPSPLADSQAQLKSAKAATDCIREAAEFVQSVPKSHYLVFHGQYVFVSAVVLLQCIRCSEDTKFVYGALKDVENAMDVLHSLQNFWHGAKKCRATVEEYLDFTFFVLQGGGKKGVCQFGCHNGPKDQTLPMTAAHAAAHVARTGHAPSCLVSKKRAAPDSLRDPKRARKTGGSHARKSDKQTKQTETRPESQDSSAPGSGPGTLSSGSESHNDMIPSSAVSLASSSASILAMPSTSSYSDSDTILETTSTMTIEYAEPPILQTVGQSFEQHTDPFAEPMVEGKCFDSTIDNFLSAISPGFCMQDTFFNGLAGLDFADSETTFLSPDGDGLQHSFF